MAKPNTPNAPTLSDERLLEQIVNPRKEYITIRYKKFGISDLTGHGRHKISQILLKEGGNEFAIGCKCLAAAKLNGYFAIKFLWWFVWRWYYYVRQYKDAELTQVLDLIKKKVAEEAYLANTILMIGMRETMMQMNRQEVSASLHALSTAKAGKSAKSDNG